MKSKKEQIDTMSSEEIFEISEYVLNHSILLMRNLSFCLLNYKIQTDECNEWKNIFARCLVDLTDIAHNLPSYLKRKNEDGLKTELKCLMDFFDDKLLNNQDLIQDMNANVFIHYFTEKGLIEK